MADLREEIMDGQHQANLIVQEVIVKLSELPHMQKEVFKDELKFQLNYLLK